MAEWPEYVLGNANKDLYVYMQGPSEFGIAGVLETWDNLKDLSKISAPTLVIDACRKDYVRNPVAERITQDL
jgi:proline iminopeptidase